VECHIKSNKAIFSPTISPLQFLYLHFGVPHSVIGTMKSKTIPRNILQALQVLADKSSYSLIVANIE
jgi:hypothetical protein